MIRTFLFILVACSASALRAEEWCIEYVVIERDQLARLVHKIGRFDQAVSAARDHAILYGSATPTWSSRFRAEGKEYSLYCHVDGKIADYNFTVRDKTQRGRLLSSTSGKVPLERVMSFKTKDDWEKDHYVVLLRYVGMKPGWKSTDQPFGQVSPSRPQNEIAIAKAWLAQLRRKDATLPDVMAYMSGEFNFDGKLLRDKKAIQERAQKMRAMFTSPSWRYELTEFTYINKNEIGPLFEGSRRYRLLLPKTQSMVAFNFRAILKSTGESNTDRVYLGFDANKKLLSWFD